MAQDAFAMPQIIAREVEHMGKRKWLVRIPKKLNAGKHAKRYFSAANYPKYKYRGLRGPEAKATEFADELNALRLKAGHRLLSMPDDEQVAVMHAVDELRTVQRVKEIGAAVRHYLGLKVLQTVSVVQAVGECVSEKARQNLSPRYIREFRKTLERFALGKENTPIDEIGTDQIEDFLNRLNAAASRRSQLIDIQTLFAYALRRGYVRENIAKTIPKPQRDEMEPGILTVEQAKAVLVGAYTQHPECLRFVILVLFGGARPEEARSIDAGAVKDRPEGDTAIKFGLIDIPASVSKTGRRRLIETNATFQAWWSLGIGELPITEARARKVREFAKPWPHDGLRHSFVSYHSALHGEVATSTAAGHSIAVMHRHYKAAVTKDSARQFFDLTPEKILTAPADKKEL